MWICIIDVSHPVARINAIELAGLAKSDPINGLYYTDKFCRIIERFSFSFTPPIPSPAYKHLLFFWHTPIVIDTLLLPMQPCTDTGKNRIGQSVVTDDDADVDAYFRTGKNPRQSPFGRSENVHAKGKSIPFNYKLKFSHIFIFFFPQHTEIINGAKSGIFTNQEPWLRHTIET